MKIKKHDCVIGHIRKVNGIIIMDKPSGISSNKLLLTVKSLFQAQKAGHTGSLDLLATGMLPICFGEATKFSQYLLNSNKRYRVVAKLGECTDTLDINGNIIGSYPIKFNKYNLTQAISYIKNCKFQMPPMFSAIKYHGLPLYKYARQGINIQRIARFIHIYDMQLIFYDNPNISFEIYCSKGTYIRVIIDSLGKYLGCGAHVVELRRLSLAHYSSSSMITLSFLLNIRNNMQNNLHKFVILDKLLLPVDSALLDMPVINVSRSIANDIRFGKTVCVKTSLQDGLVRMTQGITEEFFGIGKICATQWLSPYRLLNYVSH